MEKLPYTKCKNFAQWDYVYSELDKLGYEFAHEGYYIEGFTTVILDFGKFGVYGCLYDEYKSTDREYIEDVRDFIKRAAELMGKTVLISAEPDKTHIENTIECANSNDFSNDFKKSDLKSGMIVEYRNGKRRMVCHLESGEIFLSGCCTGENILIECFNEDLTHKGNIKNLDIMKIYIITCPASIADVLCKTNTYAKLIWERPSTLTVTKAEVAAKFGVSEINIVD